MAGIWQWNDLGGVEETITDAFNFVKSNVNIEDKELEQSIRRLVLEDIFVTGPWANDGAKEKETPISFFAFSSMEGVSNEHSNADFVSAAGAMQTMMAEVINTGEIDIAQPIIENTPPASVEITVAPYSQLPEVLSFVVSNSAYKNVFSLTRSEYVDLSSSNYRNAPRTPLTQYIEQQTGEEEPQQKEEQQTEGTEEQQEEQENEQEEELSEEETLSNKFPNIPEHLLSYVKDNGKLEVTVGKKDTKTVDPRAPYDFEIVQMTDRPSPRSLPFKADPSIVGDVMSGIGAAISRGMFRRTQKAEITGNIEPPATFPRTGVYIRNYLFFEGPSYALNMFKDLLVYLAYVNSVHGYKLRVGTYKSFREYIYMLNRVPKLGGPRLIQPLSQQQAASRELETIPDHPKNPNKKAPWLERRQYYEIVEDNKDDDVWRDIYGWIEDNSDSQVKQ